MYTALEVFWIFLKLGLTSFGGPVAHLGYFHHEFVTSRKWIEETLFSELVALCQFLPGPASSQVSLALGYFRAGYAGAFLAWLAFTLPSAAALILFSYGLSAFHSDWVVYAIHGLKMAAVAIVAHAVWALAKNFCTSFFGALIALSTAGLNLIYPHLWLPLILLPAAGLAGIFLAKTPPLRERKGFTRLPSVKISGIFLLLFFSFLILIPPISYFLKNESFEIFHSFYRAGALVFGGGHVVLPFLKQITVDSGLLSADTFLAGYGATQAIPGPLFSFAAYLGASLPTAAGGGLPGALLCLVAIFLPAVFILFGTLRLWQVIAQNPAAQKALIGINAAVVGLLAAAFIDPIALTGVTGLKDFFVVVFSVVALTFFKTPSWLVVAFCTLLGLVLN